MADTLIGKISHYYDKISVAVIEVTAQIKVGEEIKVVGHGKEFTQAIDSMQIEHEQIKVAKKGMAIGLKVTEPVKPGDEVYKVV